MVHKLFTGVSARMHFLSVHTLRTKYRTSLSYFWDRRSMRQLKVNHDDVNESLYDFVNHALFPGLPGSFAPNLMAMTVITMKTVYTA